MPTGRWVPCTPAWVSEFDNMCGATVRRPILLPLKELPGQIAPLYEAVGHEHLMVVWAVSGHVTPFRHESGEPA